jgi:hypothetical protein
MSQFCPACGVPAVPGATHCTSCGAAFPSDGMPGEGMAPTQQMAAVPPPAPPPPPTGPPIGGAAPPPSSGGKGSNTPLIVVIAVLATLVVAGLIALVVVAVGGDDGDDAATTTSTTLPATTTSTSTSTTTSTTTTTAPPTTAPPTTAAPTGPGDVLAQPAGLLCRDLRDRGYSYRAAVDYWYFHGQPDRMDADRNGIPCETVYPRSDVAAYWGSTPVPAYEGVPVGLLCRDLAARGYSYADAVAYWFATGTPDNMDADLNGIPCETVYPAAEVDAYWFG